MTFHLKDQRWSALLMNFGFRVLRNVADLRLFCVMGEVPPKLRDSCGTQRAHWPNADPSVFWSGSISLSHIRPWHIVFEMLCE